MANRCTLHRKHLDAFKEWLVNNGWTIETSKGTWEVLRARKAGRPLIIYDRLEGDHFSFMDRDYGVVKAFIRANNKNDLGVDCISRIKTIDYLCKHCPDDGECFKDCDEIKHLRQMPPVTPQESKTGHWIGNYQVDFGEWQEYDVKLSDGFITDNCHCSECGEELFLGDRGMFCPNCGAKMYEPQESEGNK